MLIRRRIANSIGLTVDLSWLISRGIQCHNGRLRISIMDHLIPKSCNMLNADVSSDLAFHGYKPGP